MKQINLIKMLYPSIHPPYISWFYLNQFNVFLGLFSELNVSSKKRSKSRRGNCLVLPHASYGPAFSGNSSILKWKKPQDIQLEESQILWTLKALHVILKFSIGMDDSIH